MSGGTIGIVIPRFADKLTSLFLLNAPAIPTSDTCS